MGSTKELFLAVCILSISMQMVNAFNPLQTIERHRRAINLDIFGGLFGFGGSKQKQTIAPPRAYPFYPFNIPASLEYSKLTTDMITVRFDVLKAALEKLGYKNSLSASDYTAILSSGGFIYNGAKYSFDVSIGRYVGGTKAELSTIEYNDIIRILRVRTVALGFSLSESELNNIITTGFYTYNNIKWYYNFGSGSFDNVELPVDQYLTILNKFKLFFGGLGFGTITEDEYKAAIKASAFTRYGLKWQFNFITGAFTRVLLSEADHKAILNALQVRLVALGYQPLSDLEILATLRNCIIIRGNIRFAYSARINRYEQRELTDAEFRYFLPQLRLSLSLLGFTDLTEKEYFRIIQTGVLIRGTIKYVFDFQKSTLEKVPLTPAEWNLLLDGIKLQISGLGITGLTDDQYKEILNTGILIHGADKWKLDPATGKFIKIVLSETEQRRVLALLSDYFLKFGWPVLTESEILYALRTGAVFRFGKKWKYDATTGRYELTDITPDEYKSFLIRLREELGQLGFTDVTDAECEKIIRTGIFFRGGNKYDFNYNSGQLLKVALTEAESKILYNNIRIQLIPLGVTGLSDEEIKQIAATGKFIHGSDKWVYDFENNIFNKVVLPESENRVILLKLSDQLKVLGQQPLTEDEIIEALKTNVVIRPGVKWIYNANTGSYEITNQTTDDINKYIKFVQDEIIRLGYDALTQPEYLQIVTKGYFIRGGYKWVLDYIRGILVKVPLDANDYKNAISQTKEQLIKIGFGQLTDDEIKKIIDTGVYVSGSDKWIYDVKTNAFIKVQLPESDNRILLLKLQEELKALSQPQLSVAEFDFALKNGYIIRPGIKWGYDHTTGKYQIADITTTEYNNLLVKLQNECARLGITGISTDDYKQIIKTGKYTRDGKTWIFNFATGELVKEGISDADYNIVLVALKEQIKQLGYQFTDDEYKQAIANGYIIIGGIKWIYNPIVKKFEIVKLSESEYQTRLSILNKALAKFGQSALTDAQLREIIYNGYFTKGGYRWEYSTTNESFVIYITYTQYEERLEKLREQLVKIGYGPITDAEGQKAIINSYFNFEGSKWTYNFDTGVYEKRN